MKKWISCTLAAALSMGALSVSALAADRTIYLSGYAESTGVTEVTAEGSELSLQGELEDYGTVVYSDFGEDLRDFKVPVYRSETPVTVTITGGIDKNEPTSGGDEGGSWTKIPLDNARVDAMTYDSSTGAYTTAQENAVYFDGTFAVSNDDGDPSDQTMTIEEKVRKEQQEEEYLSGWIYNGASAVLSEPGIYRVSVSLRGIEGCCDVFIWVGERIVPSFTDVAADAYYADAVAWAVEQEITTGTTFNTFSPKQTCTTAQILTFLWRAEGCPEPTGDNPFKDVAEDAYYAKAAVWAYEQGMVTGTVFDGASPCTRSATVTYLWILAGKPEAEAASFTDVAADAGYAQAVSWAVAQGITTGATQTTFDPDATCTRGQIVTFLYRNASVGDKTESKPASGQTTGSNAGGDSYEERVSSLVAEGYTKEEAREILELMAGGYSEESAKNMVKMTDEELAEQQKNFQEWVESVGGSYDPESGGVWLP